MIPWLPAGSDFPPVETALDDPDGLLAAGNDLSPPTLLRAYRRGIFPWFDDNQPILWWSPDPRCVFRHGDFHISRSLRRHLNGHALTFTLDRDFEAVIDACAAPRDELGGTWITEDMRAAYLRLHALGYAHCLAVHEDGELAGGIYGVQLGGVFFGESMFSTRTNGSKSALAALWALAPDLGFELLDAQVENPHLLRLGARMLPRKEFQRRLDALIADSDPRVWPAGPFTWKDLAG